MGHEGERILTVYQDRRVRVDRGQPAHEQENALLAAAIELHWQLDRVETLDDAAHCLVHRLAETLNAENVMLFWRERERSPLRGLAFASEPIDPIHTAAAEEVALLSRTVQHPASNASGHDGNSIPGRGGMMAIAQCQRVHGLTKLVGACLYDDEGGVCGCVMVFNAATTSTPQFLDALSRPLSAKLQNIVRHQGGVVHAIAKLFKQSSPSHWRWIAVACVAVVLVMFAPATYTIGTKIELQPVQRRFVAVAFDGPLKRCHVLPGDVIREGDLLAEIDPREIQYELAGIEAELAQAMQAEKTSLAQQDFAAGRFAKLESDRLRVKSELLHHRRDHLEIRSPIDGIIVSGDWRSREGTPLTRGETLFEIAPLSEMVVELWVPEADIGHVRVGMPVRFFTTAMPDHVTSGTIASVHPKAELKEHENVFIAKIKISNSEGWLQPGMRGRATIYGDSHAIGWNLLHRPWYALRNRIGV